MLKRVLKLFRLVAAGLISVAESLAAQSRANILSPDESIQQAIDAAPSGAVICLGEGTWKENIEIRKSLTIRGAGAGKTVIRSAELNRPVVWIEGDEIEVDLEGVTITGDIGFSSVSDPPKRCPIGLVVKGSAKVSLQGSEVSENEDDGLWVGDSAQVILQGSTVSSNGHGLEVKDSARVEVRESLFLNNAGAGIWVLSEKAQVEGTPNEMRGNGVDLLGYAPPSLRKPLVPQTDRTQLSVPGDYATIQEAVDAVAPGGTITIAEGTYIGGVTLWKPVTLRGAGREATILQAQEGQKLVISIPAGVQGVRLGKLAVEGSESDGLLIYGQAHLEELEVYDNGESGLEVGGYAQVTLQDSIVFGNDGNGLWVEGSAQVTLKNSEVSDNEGDGLRVSDSAQVILEDSTVSGNEMDGLSVGGSAQVNLRDSTVSGNVDEGLGNVCAGLSVGGSAQVTLRSSTISGNNGDGLKVKGSAQVILQDSKVYRNWLGFNVGGSTLVILENSEVCGNNDGLLVGGSAQVILQDSKVYRNGHGFNVGGSTRVSLQGSTISENRGRGLDVRASAQVSLTNSRVAGNGELGLFVGGSAQVSLWNSEVSLNMAFGLSVNDSARVSLKSSTVSGNWKGGLVVHDSAQVSIEGSLIEENGSVLRCKAYWSCNGIAVEGKAHVELTSTTIRKNPGWGIAASHFNFEGKVLWEGRGNEIYDNGKGDVCLP